MNTGVLIPTPVLDDRQEELRIAQSLVRMGKRNIQDVQFDFEVLRQAESILLAGGSLPTELIAGITSMRVGEVPYTLCSELARLPSQMLFRLNQVPELMRIAFLQLLNTTLIPALSATTTLRFTKLPGFVSQQVTIPEGTIVASANGKFKVSTPELIIPADQETGDVEATSTIAGNIGQRVPAGAIGIVQSAIGGILSVTNITALGGGRDAESVASAIIRARESMRIGQHLGSSDDYITHIFQTILRGLGRVTPFEFYRGDFELLGPGYLTLSIQGEDGFEPSSSQFAEIASVVNSRHVAGIMVVARTSIYKSFSLSVGITTSVNSSDTEELKKQAEASLRARFNPLRFNYGTQFPNRVIGVSDVIGAVEEVSPQQISVAHDHGQFDVTITVHNDDNTTTVVPNDLPFAIGELPLLVEANLHVV